MAGRLISLAAVFLAASAWAPAGHGQLADPTKPPPAFQALQAPAASVPDPAVPAAAGGGLQSTILRKQGKPAALINGEVVELGGKLGEAKLIEITENTVVLRGPEGKETLHLTPAAEKKVGAGETVGAPKPSAGVHGGSAERGAYGAQAAGTKVGAGGAVSTPRRNAGVRGGSSEHRAGEAQAAGKKSGAGETVTQQASGANEKGGGQ